MTPADKGPALLLRRGKDKAVRNRHHWIYSGAVQSLADVPDGSLVGVRAADGAFLGHAYINRKCSILGRMVNFDERPPLEAIEDALDRALALRTRFFDAATNAFRLVNAEGDGLPGLIVDRYGDVLVLQVSTLGIERLKPDIVRSLVRRMAPRSVYEKSNVPARREEGLPMFEGRLFGEEVGVFEVLENGRRFLIDIPASQKTGFYLDQREMRRLAGSLARGRRVLNAFSYTGGFSVFALAGGAAAVDSVDASESALALARENCRLNGFLESPENRFFAADVFDFIRERSLDYDFVVLDPPAFAKRKEDVVRACRGYKDLHRVVFQKVPASSLVMTFSCSFFVDETLFRQVVFQASREASRNVRILQRHHHAYDHPLNIYHPESDYLKGFLLYVD
jgi:23S rRNA (cytosine1962-C5)-methyltransferase